MIDKHQMIAMSGCIGIGFYISTGPVPGPGGPIAIIMSFALVGVLALSVMMSIAEMVSIRPMLFGEMSGFVTEFVDVELGVAVGIVYW
jgi:amino acid transporter